MDDIVTKLTAARELIADEKHWNQGYRILSRDGIITHCIFGALDEIGANTGIGSPIVSALFTEIKDPSSLPSDPFNPGFDPDAWVYPIATIARFNNTQPHTAVIALIDKAIATASGNVPAEEAEKPKEVPANLLRF